MIIIDSQQELANFLEKLSFDSLGIVKLDQVTFELSQSVIDELTIVHEDVLAQASAQVLAKLDELTMFILYAKDPAQVKTILTNMVDIITPSTTLELFNNKVQLLSELIKERQVLKSQLISINKELSETMGNVEVELLRIKKVYEQKTPRRFNNIKGIQAYSKYAAGESVGGEFFDIHMNQNKAFVIMSSTSSYLASSSILQMFSQLKSSEEISEQIELNLIEDIKQEVVELNKSKKKEISIHLFTAIIDLSKHTVSGHLFGDFKILSSNSNNSYSTKGPILLNSQVNEGEFERNLKRGERLLLCSPGFSLNWQKLNPEFIVEELMIKKSIKPLDILDEIFYQLKKDSSSGFLSYDASAIMLEVQQNAMVQV